MATVWPAARSARTRSRFCSGVTRPKTWKVAAARSTSAGVSSVEASTQASAPGTPTARAILETVRGSSPEMTFRVTPCETK